MKRKQAIESVRRNLALRYRQIETVALWKGRLTTNCLVQSVGISRQQASKGINTSISEHAPENHTDHRRPQRQLPSKGFTPRLIEDSASA